MGILYTPFGWILRSLYNLSGNYLLAILIFTIVIKLILLPSSISQQKGTARQQRLQPKLKHIQEKYGYNRAKVNEETQALYQREGFSPMSNGCLPLVIQLPIIWGLYGVIYRPIEFVLKLPKASLTSLEVAYKAIAGAATKSNQIQLNILSRLDDVLNYISAQIASGAPAKDITAISPDIAAKLHSFSQEFSVFGVSLGQVPPSLKGFSALPGSTKLLILVPILAALSQMLTSIFMFFRQKKTNPEMTNIASMGCTIFLMPLISLFFAFEFPIGIGVYWILQSILSFIQTVILSYIYEPKKVLAVDMVKETIEHRSKEKMFKLAKENQEKSNYTHFENE